MKTWARLKSFFRRETLDADMAEEMRAHVERRTQANLAAGMSADEARFAAQRQFGGADQPKELAREQRGWMWLENFFREVRHSARRLIKQPGFTATVLAILALCLGANLAIFAVVDAVLLRPLPFPASERLVTVFNTYPKAGVLNDGSSLTNYYERRGNLAAFSSLSIYREDAAIVGETGATDRQRTMRVSPEFFATLGVNPALGRAFTEEETSDQTDRVVILTDACRRQHFAAEPDVLGREIRVDGSPRKIVGVLPPEFRFLSSEARLYFPFSSHPRNRAPAERHAGGGATKMIARLAPGVPLAAAQAQIDAHNAAVAVGDLEAKAMAEAGFRSPVVPLHADHVASIRPMLLLIQAGALFLLLIGAVNLVNLLLIRASARAKELAVRQAMGASRRHVVADVLAETTVLAIGGGLLGLVVGAWGISLLTVLGADRLPLGAHLAFDARLAALALAVAVALGGIIAVPIAWFNLRGHLARALQSESRGGTVGRAAQRVRHGLIVAQIALAFVLLSGAGLLGISLRRIMAVSPGFQAGHTLSGRISLPSKNYGTASARLAFAESVVDEIGRQPGVLAAGVSTNVPFSGDSGKSSVTVVGYVRPPGESPRATYSFGVDGDYFNALGFSLRAGRFLTAADSRRSERVCVVDEAFARRYWPAGGALGRRLHQGYQRPGETKDEAEAFTVVGVVGTAKQADLAESEALGSVYYPFGYRSDGSVFVVVRSVALPSSLGPVLQSVVRRIDPELPVNDLRSMETRIDESLGPRRSPAVLAGIFAGVALLLAAVGTYGVLACAVAQRRREIGVRMALGALPGQVLAQFLSLGAKLLLAGVLIGALGAWSVGHAMQGLLFGVGVANAGIFGGTAAIMMVVVLFAVFLPSRRAARISPMEALRAE